MTYGRSETIESFNSSSVGRWLCLACGESPVSFACSVMEELNRNQDLCCDRSEFDGFVDAIDLI
jgi:hypothetical protein